MSPAAGGYWCPICGAVAKTRSVSRRRGLSGQALYLLSLTSSMSPAGGGYRHINDPNSVQLQCVPRGRGLSVLQRVSPASLYVCPPHAGVIDQLVFSELMVFGAGPVNGGMDDSESSP